MFPNFYFGIADVEHNKWWRGEKRRQRQEKEREREMVGGKELQKWQMTGEWVEEKGGREAREERKQKKKNDFWPSVFSKAFMVGKHLELFWPNNIYLPCFWNHIYVEDLCSVLETFNLLLPISRLDSEVTQVRRPRRGAWGQHGWHRNHSCALALKSREPDWGHGPPDSTSALGSRQTLPRHQAEPSTFICCTHLITATACL